MFRTPHSCRSASRGGPGRRTTATLALIVLFAGLGFSPGTALATAPEHQPAHTIAAGWQGLGSQPVVRTTPLLADWLDIILNPIVSFVNTRQRMIQVGALVMLLALTIIWWRK